jgi:hypothetical protein
VLPEKSANALVLRCHGNKKIEEVGLRAHPDHPNDFVLSLGYVVGEVCRFDAAPDPLRAVIDEKPVMPLRCKAG